MTAVMERPRVAKATVSPRRWMLGGMAIALAFGAAIAVLYLTVPKSRDGDWPVDALVVLGTPADLHGDATDMQRWRVDEAVREFRARRAPRIVFSGGPTSHGFTEAAVMARYARQQGVPASAILLEGHSYTTLQNIAYSARLLQAHGWYSVEVISTPEHLPRAAVLLDKTGLSWRVRAAPTPGRSRIETSIAYGEEAFGTAAMRVFGTAAEPVLHRLARSQYGMAYGVRWVAYRVKGWLER